MSIRDEKKQKSRERLRELLSHPEHRGRVVKISELTRKLGCAKSTFYENIGNVTLAQEWLTINQDAPTDAKLYYKNMLDEGLKKVQADVEVTIGNKGGRGGRESGKRFFVPKDVATIKAARASDMLRRTENGKQKRIELETGVTVRQITTETKMVEVSERDALIQRVRDAYVLAPMGELPNVREIMQEYGILDSKGNPTQGVTEDDVREVMQIEDWKNERLSHLHRTQDLIMDEVKMVSMVRALEVQKMLFNEAKVIHRQNMQYHNTGRVKTLDGAGTLPYEADSGTLAGLAEVMRRMVDGGLNINILVNQFGGGDAQTKGSQISMVSRAYIARLGAMSPEDLAKESERFVALANMLDGEDAKAVSLDEIQRENEIVDAQFSRQEPDEK
jgi:hypothetical protein